MKSAANNFIDGLTDGNFNGAQIRFRKNVYTSYASYLTAMDIYSIGNSGNTSAYYYFGASNGTSQNPCLSVKSVLSVCKNTFETVPPTRLFPLVEVVSYFGLCYPLQNSNSQIQANNVSSHIRF